MIIQYNDIIKLNDFYKIVSDNDNGNLEEYTKRIVMNIISYGISDIITRKSLVMSSINYSIEFNDYTYDEYGINSIIIEYDNNIDIIYIMFGERKEKDNYYNLKIFFGYETKLKDHINETINNISRENSDKVIEDFERRYLNK